MLFSPSDYRLIDQYNADMFALLPFYPFACKGELEQIENDPQNRKKLVERLRWIITGLGHAAAN